MKKAEAGFTLIELLVVVAIIGILAAIAIPQFNSYRQRGYDSAARSDLRNAAVAQEAYFVQNNEYRDCTDSACLEGGSAALPGLRSLSNGVTLSMTATTTGFTATSSNSLGSGAVYTWNSANGGMQP
jgi:type IV pilus assembly protein PilA